MNLKNKISEVLKDYILELTEPLGDLTLTISPENIIKTCEKLKNDPELDFQMLTDLTVVDWLTYPKKSKSPHRFHIIIILLSIKFLWRIYIHVPIDNQVLEIPSLTGLWKNANWLEREAWDMYGVRFKNHPDLKRILLYPEFQGHPLRKDYPVNKRQPLLGPKN